MYYYHRHIQGAYCKRIEETHRGCKVLQTGTSKRDTKKSIQAHYDGGDMAGHQSLWIKTGEKHIPAEIIKKLSRKEV